MCVLYSLIILFLYDISQFRAVLFNVMKTNEQGVPLRTDQLPGCCQVFQFSLVFLIPYGRTQSAKMQTGGCSPVLQYLLFQEILEHLLYSLAQYILHYGLAGLRSRCYIHTNNWLLTFNVSQGSCIGEYVPPQSGRGKLRS